MDNHSNKREDGIYVGNQLDKNSLKNPISRSLVNGFDSALFRALDEIKPYEIHEVGCGEGRLAKLISERYSVNILASDFSKVVIKENLKKAIPRTTFIQLSIYDLDPEIHTRNTVVCCEVLEHLEDPKAGMKKLYELNAHSYIISVPREPVWRVLNIFRLKYLRELGNTPGHLNHWNYKKFKDDLEEVGFKVIEVYNPFPWLMFRLKK